ncbi:MAG: hypothetical protein QOG27_1848, partial [Verrucomicrobiota bacterium]
MGTADYADDTDEEGRGARLRSYGT